MRLLDDVPNSAVDLQVKDKVTKYLIYLILKRVNKRSFFL